MADKVAIFTTEPHFFSRENFITWNNYKRVQHKFLKVYEFGLFAVPLPVFDIPENSYNKLMLN